MRTGFDFSGDGAEGKLKTKEETIYVNVAWMTLRKTSIEDRSMPIIVTLTL